MVSWLPLYHDMGLVGFLSIPMTQRLRSSCRPRRRTSWPSRATGCSGSATGAAPATAGPNFSWVLATRALGADATTSICRSLTLALSGAEPVDPKAVEAFVAAAEPFGFQPGGVFPAFGMAEVAIGGVVPAAAPRAWSCDSVDRVVLERDRVAKPLDLGRRRRASSTCAASRCSARPVPGLEMRIVDPDDVRGAARTPRRRAAAARHVGDTRLLQAPRRDGRAVPRRLAVHRRPRPTCSTASWCCAGASRTSSSSAAATCSPRTSSAPSAALDGVRAGNVIAFGVEGYKGKESVVVVAEVRGRRRRPRVREAIHHRTLEVVRPAATRRDAGASRARCRRPRRGKLQRAKCRELYLAEELELLATSTNI